jgi:hypothetical protein
MNQRCSGILQSKRHGVWVPAFAGTTKDFRMPQNSRIDPRWIRHDAHLWIQPNIERWMKPGVDPADVIPALAEKRAQEDAAKARARAAEDAAFDAFIEGERRLLAAMREELNEIKAELARRRRLAEQTKYSPSQPRVPAGNSRDGQWTDGSTGGSIARPMGSVDAGNLRESSELTGLFQIKPAEPGAGGVQVAGRPVDLLGEEERDGHTIAEHVGKSEQWMLNDARSNAESAIRKGDYFDDFRSGSFTSLEAANKLVNATIAANQGKVDRVVIDRSPKETLDHDFDTPTGREAYMRNERSQAVMRDTYSVRVVIVPDSSERGYRVLTAFPRNR